MDEASEGATAGTAGGGRIELSTALKLGLGLALVVVSVIFAVQNTASTELDFLAWTFDVPRIVLMAASAVVGVLVWQLAGFLRRRRRRGD